MSYFITGSGLITEFVKLTGSTAVDVLDMNRAVTVASITCTETLGATPNLTIAIYEPAGPTTYYIRNAVAMTAKQTFTYNEPFVIPTGWKLRVTSSAGGGGVDVMVNYFNPNAAGIGQF